MKGKRLLAVLFALVLTFGAMSLTALAETDTGSEATNPYEDTGESITIEVSYSREGAFVVGEDGTVLSRAKVTVYDDNEDGKFTMSEGFRAMHREYYSGGISGFEDTSGGWITKVWGVQTAMVSYVRNNSWVFGTTQEIEDGDYLALYEYSDLANWSDLYTWFDSDSYDVPLSTASTFTVNGVSVFNSGTNSDGTVNNVAAAPEDATVKVYDQDGDEVSGMDTVTDAEGKFTLTFDTDGIYTVEVNGTCKYTCDGYGGTYKVSYDDAPVVPLRCTVKAGAGDALLGDINGDGVVNLSDVIALLNKVTDEEDVALGVGDINGDGVINLSDVISLLGKVTES